MPSWSWENAEAVQVTVDRLAGRKPSRPFLVFVVPSPKVLSPLLMTQLESRNFDIAVRFYEPPGINHEFLQCAEYVMTGGLSKFHAASQFLREKDLCESYKGYLFIDGDLEFDARELGNFLSLVEAAELDLAQPSVTRDSFCYWSVAYHQPGFVLRQTSFVEVMAPYLSQRALTKTIRTFDESISTYGLDLVWPSLIESSAIGVVDAFQIRHKDRVDHRSGSFYTYLRSIGVDLDKEEQKLLSDYGVKLKWPCSLRGYICKGDPLPSSSEPRIISIALPSPERKTKRRFLIDLMMSGSRHFATPREERELSVRWSPYLAGPHIKADTSGLCAAQKEAATQQ